VHLEHRDLSAGFGGNSNALNTVFASADYLKKRVYSTELRGSVYAFRVGLRAMGFGIF
jgi:hypothetical protein